MVLNSFAGRFVISNILAERQGVTDQAARTRLAVLGGALGSSATGLVVTTVLARREAEAEQENNGSTPLPSAPLVVVPDVIGLSFEKAQETLKAASKQFVVQRQEAIDPKQEAGIVVFQTPSAGGAPIAENSAITLFVNRQSTVPARTMPNVINKSVEQAIEELRPLQLTIGVIEIDSTKPKGMVVMQSRDEGTDVSEGDSVTLLVSTGTASAPELVNLPDVVGKSRQEAEKSLKDMGFVVQVEPLDSGEPSFVKEQNPKGGADVFLPKGSTVTLKVESRSPGVN